MSDNTPDPKPERFAGIPEEKARIAALPDVDLPDDVARFWDEWQLTVHDYATRGNELSDTQITFLRGLLQSSLLIQDAANRAEELFGPLPVLLPAPVFAAVCHAVIQVLKDQAHYETAKMGFFEYDPTVLAREGAILRSTVERLPHTLACWSDTGIKAQEEREAWALLGSNVQTALTGKSLEEDGTESDPVLSELAARVAQWMQEYRSPVVTRWLNEYGRTREG